MRGFDSRWALLTSGWGNAPISQGSVRSVTLVSHRCGGARAGTGRRLLTVPAQVRFLPPQLNGTASRLAMAAASKAVEREQRLDEFDSLTFRSKQHLLLAERQRLQASNLARRVRLPQGTLSGA